MPRRPQEESNGVQVHARGTPIAGRGSILIVCVLSEQSLSNIFLGGNCRQRFRAARSRSARYVVLYRGACIARAKADGRSKEKKEKGVAAGYEGI